MERCSENKPDMCSLCSVILSSPTVASAHYNGQMHKKNSEKEGNCANFFCEVCQVLCTGKGPYQEHCNSKKHLQRCSENMLKNKMCSNGEISHLKSSSGYFDKSLNYDLQNSNHLSVDNMKGINSASHKSLLIKIIDGGGNVSYKNDSPSDNCSNTIHLDNPCQILIKHMEKVYQITINQDRFDLLLQSPDRSFSKTLISSTKTEITSLKDERETFPLECEVCKKSFNGQQPAKEHFKSIAHIKKKKLIEENEENPAVFCKLCNVKCLDEKQMAIHLESQKHNKMKTKTCSSNNLEQAKQETKVESFEQSYKENNEMNEAMPSMTKSCMSEAFFINEEVKINLP